MVGIRLGPDLPHEGSQGPCQLQYGGICRCKRLAWVNGNPKKLNHAKKTEYLLSVRSMGHDTFTFDTTLVDESENAVIHRRACDSAVGLATKHHHRDHVCCAEVWICGRCYLRIASDEVGGHLW